MTEEFDELQEPREFLLNSGEAEGAREFVDVEDVSAGCDAGGGDGDAAFALNCLPWLSCLRVGGSGMTGLDACNDPKVAKLLL